MRYGTETGEKDSRKPDPVHSNVCSVAAGRSEQVVVWAGARASGKGPTHNKKALGG